MNFHLVIILINGEKIMNQNNFKVNNEKMGGEFFGV